MILYFFFFCSPVGIITYFCPCYIIGKNAEAVGDSCCICALAHFFWPINLWSRVHVRGKIREQKGIAVSLCEPFYDHLSLYLPLWPVIFRVRVLGIAVWRIGAILALSAKKHR